MYTFKVSSNSTSPSSANETKVKIQNTDPEFSDNAEDSYDYQEKIAQDKLSIKHQLNVLYDKDQFKDGDITYQTAATGSQTKSRLSDSQQTSKSPPSQPSN